MWAVQLNWGKPSKNYLGMVSQQPERKGLEREKRGLWGGAIAGSVLIVTYAAETGGGSWWCQLHWWSWRFGRGAGGVGWQWVLKGLEFTRTENFVQYFCLYLFLKSKVVCSINFFSFPSYWLGTQYSCNAQFEHCRVAIQ